MTLESLHLTAKVKLMAWVPQNDVLGHPAVKAFLSHAGINSIYEAAYHAVPIVSVPLIGDQVNNAVLVKTLPCGHATTGPAHPHPQCSWPQRCATSILAEGISLLLHMLLCASWASKARFLVVFIHASSHVPIACG